MAEVGLAPGGTTQSAVGGLFHGTKAAVGDGAKRDFLLVFDRVNPAIIAFAVVIEGKLGAIWWSPAQTEAHFVTNAVPEPASGRLLVAAAGAAALVRRHRQGV